MAEAYRSFPDHQRTLEEWFRQAVAALIVVRTARLFMVAATSG
jgi:hypothetical protein